MTRRWAAIISALCIAVGFFLLKLEEAETIEVFAQKEDLAIKTFETDRKEIALTIETGFSGDRTDDILAALKKHRVKAAFCIVGLWAEENPELLQRINEEGHEIISHSMFHGRYSEMREKEVLEDAAAASALILNLTGNETGFIRLPYNEEDDELLKTLLEAGFTPLSYSLDARDWSKDKADRIVGRLLKKLVPGDIVSFMSNGEESAEAIDCFLAEIIERGYRVKKLGDVL